MRRAGLLGLALVTFGCSSFGAEAADGGAPQGTHGGGADGGSAEGGADIDAGSAKSCAELHQAQPTLGDGVYSIDFTGGGAAEKVYCEMTTLGGGWTLVARSVDGVDTRFGWGVANGSVDNDGVPYSFDVAGHPWLAPTEMLFGARGDGKTWAAPVYLHALPPDFVQTYRTKGFLAGAATTVKGTCNPPGGPSFLEWIGRTGSRDSFFFRDNDAALAFGLYSSGWDSNKPNMGAEHYCDWGADLHGLQAMIFIR